MTRVSNECEFEGRHQRRLLASAFIHPTGPNLANLLYRQPYARIDDTVGLGLAKRVTAARWSNELADGGLVVPKKVGRGLVFINVDQPDRIYAVSNRAS